MSPPDTIGVVGAGTMGAGIAQLACQAGARTLLHDPFPDALARGAEAVRGGLEKAVARGRMTQEECAAAAARLETAESMKGWRRATWSSRRRRRPAR